MTSKSPVYHFRIIGPLCRASTTHATSQMASQHRDSEMQTIHIFIAVYMNSCLTQNNQNWSFLYFENALSKTCLSFNWLLVSVPTFPIPFLGEKTILQLSYLYNGISYADKTTSQYRWLSARLWYITPLLTQSWLSWQCQKGSLIFPPDTHSDHPLQGAPELALQRLGDELLLNQLTDLLDDDVLVTLLDCLELAHSATEKGFINSLASGRFEWNFR